MQGLLSTWWLNLMAGVFLSSCSLGKDLAKRGKEKAQPSTRSCPCSGRVGSTMEKLGGKDTKSRGWERSLWRGTQMRSRVNAAKSLSGQSPAKGHPEAGRVDLR